MNEETTIDCIQVTLTRVKFLFFSLGILFDFVQSLVHGFGIAISGDQQCLIISDVIRNGPADGKLL